MISVIHTKHGRSAIGLMNYLLDGPKNAPEPGRAKLILTNQLATGNARTAARAITYVALDQARLKREAGIANTGRKPRGFFMHYTLGWPKGQDVSDEELAAAFHGSLAALGETAGQKGGHKKSKGRVAVRDQFASEHQAVAVVHRDSTVHMHILLNRVHPRHGVMLPSSRDHLKLSRWSEAFELEHAGRVVVTQRALNNEARDRGEKVYAKKRVPRDVYELERDARDNHEGALKVQAEQRKADAVLAKNSASFREKATATWQAFESDHRERLRGLKPDAEKRLNTEIYEIRRRFAAKRRDLHHRQGCDLKRFEQAEISAVGRAINGLRSLLSLSAGANTLFSQGARIDAFHKRQARQKLDVEHQQRRAERDAKSRSEAKTKAQRRALERAFRLKRLELIFRYRMGRAKLRSAWKTRKLQRSLAWKAHQIRMTLRPPERSYGLQTDVPNERFQDYVKSFERFRARNRRQREEASRESGQGRAR